MKIGILDYKLTNYHLKKFHGLLTGPVGDGKITITGGAELEATDEGREWCAQNGVAYRSAEEVIAASDALLVLAPNNPETHLEVARPALATGKPVFIDKMLAQTPEDAREIIRLARESGSPLMSSSGLRFALELDELDGRLGGGTGEGAGAGEGAAVFARGLGKFPIYGVHTITLALRYYGPDVRRVIDTGQEGDRLLTLDGPRGKASIEIRDSENQYEATPWQVGVRSGTRYETVTITNFDGFYENLMRKAVEFFRTGHSPISVEEQLAVVEVQAAAEQSLASGNNWVTVEEPAAVS